MISLKQKSLFGLKWSFLDNAVNQGFQFFIGIILARILSPHDYGLIGIMTIFIAISQTFVDSGFSQALIRKVDCKDEDYNTVFIFNILVSLLFYFLLFFSSDYISVFFKEPELVLLLKVLAINIIISAFGLIERAILIKNVNFKLQAKISLIAASFSGAVSISLALSGYGVWSLVVKSILQNLCSSFLLMVYSKWKPGLIFDWSSFKQMFLFGWKLLISGLINKIYTNSYYIVIGKFFSSSDLGYYTRAEQFKGIFAMTIMDNIQRVSYPVLSLIQNDKVKLKATYRKLIKSTMFITNITMIWLLVFAEPIILVLIGEKWSPVVLYLRLLCVIGLIGPLHIYNINLLSVLGRSDLILYLEIIRKVLSVLVLVLTFKYGIVVMIIGMIFHSFSVLVLNTYWSGKFINYAILEQVKDVYVSFLVVSSVGSGIALLSNVLNMGNLLNIAFLTPIFIILVVLISELINLEEYFEIKRILLSFIK